MECHEDYYDSYMKNRHAVQADPGTPAAGQGCESCHGPGAQHAESDGQEPIRSLKTDAAGSADEKSAACLQCHTKGRQALWHGSEHQSRNLSCSSCHNIHNNYTANAATGDPDVTRDRLKLGFNIPALKTFNIKVELGHEMRQGTRPFAGAFNNAQMVEFLEPIDYETTDMKISAEYAQKGRFVNFVYHYSQFANNIDTLTFDNPLRGTDALLGPSTGRIDLAPDNQYHNLAFTGALTRLPWNSQATANVAFGWMMQDDDLVPFTSNTAISAPALPKDSADAKVNTALYQLRLTSRPRPFMRVKADLRYYDYANKTDRIEFTNGYVETDEVPIATAITNLPSSYTKTRAGLDLGFDVMTRTSLGIGYAFEGTDRENRQVDRQDGNIFNASLDTRTLDWLDLRYPVDAQV